MDNLQVVSSPHLLTNRSKKENEVALAAKSLARNPTFLVNQSHPQRMVVLAEDPVFRSDGRMRQKEQQTFVAISLTNFFNGHFGRAWPGRDLSLVNRGLLGQQVGRDFYLHPSPVENSHHAVV